MQSNGHEEARAFQSPGLTHCRSIAEIPIEAAILDTDAPPIYNLA